MAAPADEVTRAVHAGGASSVLNARPQQFVTAITAVFARSNPRDLPEYVAAAIRLRPDLSAQITAAALGAAVRTARTEKSLYVTIERILRAAILAFPDGAPTIARAAVEALPHLHDLIIGTSIPAAPQHRSAILEATGSSLSAGFIWRAGSDGSEFSASFGTMSPINISDVGGNVRSPEQPTRVTARRIAFTFPSLLLPCLAGTAKPS